MSDFDAYLAYLAGWTSAVLTLWAFAELTGGF
jgi:hypothetical protein